jgi:hypothetical protein
MLDIVDHGVCALNVIPWLNILKRAGEKILKQEKEQETVSKEIKENKGKI